MGIPSRATLRLWENKFCDGDHYDLTGDSRFHSISSLGGFGDETSCVEWLGGPFARAGADRTVECAGSTTPIQLDGRASISLDGGPLIFNWQAGAVTFDDVTSSTPIGSFPLGQTNVSLKVSNLAGENTDDVLATIVDTIAPTIACPANVVVDATMPAGAVVTYPAPAAVDTGSVRSLACGAPSGSTFAVGTSAVQCTVADFASHSASCSFTSK